MFDLDAGKILVVGVVALLVIGPKDLPRVLRTVGQTVGKMRRMATEFQSQFMEAIKEADLEDVKREVSAINESTKIDASFNPASLMRSEPSAAVEAPQTIGQSVIDLTGEAAGNAIADSNEVAAPIQDPAAHQPLSPAHESLSLGPEPERVEARAREGEIGHESGGPVRQGDRG